MLDNYLRYWEDDDIMTTGMMWQYCDLPLQNQLLHLFCSRRFIILIPMHSSISFRISNIIGNICSKHTYLGRYYKPQTPGQTHQHKNKNRRRRPTTNLNPNRPTRGQVVMILGPEGSGKTRLVSSPPLPNTSRPPKIRTNHHTRPRVRDGCGHQPTSASQTGGCVVEWCEKGDRLCIVDGGMYFGGNFGAGGAAGGRWRENRSEGTELGWCCHEGE